MKRILLAAVGVLGLVCGTAGGQEKIVIDGSTTVGPIAKAFAEYYMSKNHNVNISVSESGSGNGAKSLINGTCDIADMSRYMKEEESVRPPKRASCRWPLPWRWTASPRSCIPAIPSRG